MTTVRFADLPDLIAKYQHRLDAVVQQSTHDVAQAAQLPKAKGGRLPVVTSFLRNSFSSTLMGGTALTGPDSYVLVAGQMKAGDVASFGWTAEYGRRVNFGFVGEDKLGRTYNQQGAHFLEGAVDQWGAIVRAVVARAVREIG